MRFRTTLLFLVLALGLGAYVYLVEIPRATEEAETRSLFEFETDEATRVTLTYPDRKISLEKHATTWRMTEPVDVLADEAAMRSLLNAVANCEVKKELENPQEDRSVYGLDSPFVTVEVKLGDRQLPAVQVGKNTPVGFSTYISRADDKKILLTGSTFRSGMDKQPKDLRDKTILRFSDDEVRQIGIHGEQQNLLLTKEESTWLIEKPSRYRADPATLRSYLSTLRSLRAVDFPSDDAQDLSAYGLETPRLALDLHFSDAATATTLLIGDENDDKRVFVTIAGQPTVYAVGDWVFRDLNKNLQDFRDKTILAFDKEAVRRVEVTRADGSATTLVRQGEKWRVRGADEAAPPEKVISQYVSDLQDLKGYEIAADRPSDLEQLGLASPLLSIALFGEDDQQLGTALLGQYTSDEDKTEYTAMAAEGDTVFVVRDYLFTRLDKSRAHFLDQPTPTPSATPAVPVDFDPSGEDLTEESLDSDY